MSIIIELKNLQQNISGIYKINYPNGKIYIGQSNDIKRRMYEHNNLKRLETHTAQPCDLAIQKYGEIKEIEILEYTLPENLNEREKYWIAFYQADKKDIGYNLTEGGSVNRNEKHPKAVFTNQEVLDIRKRRANGERKIDVYNNFYKEKNFSTFEHIWLGRGYNDIGNEYLIPAHTISRQEYSSKANSGEKNGRAKLTTEEVKEIRKLYAQGASLKELQQQFNKVSKSTIYRVCKNLGWNNI